MFNPVQTARSVIIASKLSDPDEIAQVVFDCTPKDELEEAYLKMLRNAAREAIRLENMSISRTEVQTVPNKSSRVASITQAHISYYDQRVFANGDWKLLGDCTVEDVRDLARQRYLQANDLIGKAREFGQLADRMAQAGVRVARELEGLES